MERFTIEEQQHWANAMVVTWHAIAADVEEGFKLEAQWSNKRQHLTAAILVEIVCDANRLEMFGNLTPEESRFLSKIYSTPKFQRWARGVMKGYTEVIEPPFKPRQPRSRQSRVRAASKPTLSYWEKNGYTTYTGPHWKTPTKVNCK